MNSFSFKYNKGDLEFAVWNPDNTRLIFSDKLDNSDICENLEKLHNNTVLKFRLLEIKKIIENSGEIPTALLIRLKCDSETFHYEPGDHFAIYPQNQIDQVEFVLSRINNASFLDKKMCIQSLNERNEWILSDKFPVECSIREAFTCYLDINNSLSQAIISGLSYQAQNENDQLKMNCLANVWIL